MNFLSKKNELLDFINLGQKNNSIIQLKGDASSRSYYRVFLNKKSYIFCYDKMVDNDQYDFLVINHLFKQYKINVPAIYDVDFQKKIIVQQDLGDQYLSSYVGQGNLKDEMKIYQKIISQLIKIQSIDIKLMSNNTFGKRYFDMNKLMDEVLITSKNLQIYYKNIPDSDSFLDEINLFFSEILEKKTQRFDCLVHRDFHSRNIMFFDKKYYLIDYQDARIGNFSYDLASLLEDPYNAIDEGIKDKLKKKYWHQLTNLGAISYSYEEFNSIYSVFAMQRLYKALGTYLRLWNELHRHSYLVYVGTTIEKMKKLAFKNNELSAVYSLILRHYYEN